VYGSTPYRIYDAPVTSPAYVVHIAYLQPQQQQRRAHSADIQTMSPRANYVSSGLVLTFPATCLRCLFSLLPLHNSLLKIRIPSHFTNVVPVRVIPGLRPWPLHVYIGMVSTCLGPSRITRDTSDFSGNFASAAPAQKTLIYDHNHENAWNFVPNSPPPHIPPPLLSEWGAALAHGVCANMAPAHTTRSRTTNSAVAEIFRQQKQRRPFENPPSSFSLNGMPLSGTRGVCQTRSMAHTQN